MGTIREDVPICAFSTSLNPLRGDGVDEQHECFQRVYQRHHPVGDFNCNSQAASNIWATTMLAVLNFLVH